MTTTAAAAAGARRRAAAASQARRQQAAPSTAAQDWRRAPPFAFHRFATPEQANTHIAQLIMRTRDLANLYVMAEHGEPYPMTREAMDELRFLSWPVPDPPADDECAICMAKYKANDEVVQLPCEGKHCFHKRCLMEWFERQPVCPTCRFDCRGGLHGGRGEFSASGTGGGSSSSAGSDARSSAGGTGTASTRRERPPPQAAPQRQRPVGTQRTTLPATRPPRGPGAGR